MAVKETHVNSTMDRQLAYPSDERAKPSLISNWLTGLMILMTIFLAMYVVNALVNFPRDGVGAGAPMVLPEGSSVPGTTDGKRGALESIAGMPNSADTAQATSIDSKATKPDTDRLPGRDDRRPQPVLAPL